MSNILLKHLRTLAIASTALTTTYFLSNYDYSSFENNLFTVRAAEHDQKNKEKALYRYQSSEKRRIYTEIGDDADDENDEDEDKDDSEKLNENIVNPREKRFREFASLEYNGEIFMTPMDLLESIVSDRPRPRIGRRVLTDEIVTLMLSNTPVKHRGSKRFFRNLEDSGLISFSEYLFLWIILTKPNTHFEIAFAMFDTDGNQLVDKHEFLVLGKVISDKRMLHRSIKTPASQKLTNYTNVESSETVDTTLLLHLFGKNGRGTLNYSEFKRFMENFQDEILEIEFNEFSHGFKTISDLDFSEMLLRFTDFTQDTKRWILKKVKKSAQQSEGITFEQYKNFFLFLNHLEEFNIAMRFHQLSNKPISQAEFQRAVRISTGFELDPHIIGLIFRIFDADNDQHLSYNEFMNVMTDRLARGFQTTNTNDSKHTKFEQFKHCFRERAKYESLAARH